MFTVAWTWQLLSFPNIKCIMLQCPVEAITMGSPAGGGSWEIALGPAHLSQSAPLFHGESITWDLARSHSLTQVIFRCRGKLSWVRTRDFTHKSDLKGKVRGGWMDRFTSSGAFYNRYNELRCWLYIFLTIKVCCSSINTMLPVVKIVAWFFITDILSPNIDLSLCTTLILSLYPQLGFKIYKPLTSLSAWSGQIKNCQSCSKSVPPQAL